MNSIRSFRTFLCGLVAVCLLQYHVVAQIDPVPAVVPQGLSRVGNKLTGGYEYPSIEMVAEKLSEDYGVQNAYFEFEKRPEGYFIAMREPETYQTISKREMIWSAADGQWKPLSLKKGMKRVGSSSELIRDKFYYDRIPYYGYPGWYQDVIKEWEGKAPLSDVLQFSLATAWYQRAASLLSNQYGLADSLETFKLPNTKNALTQEQLDLYLGYMNRSLEHYETLVRQAPDYETIVGPATVKLADQYMTAFMQLQHYQNEATAMKILDRPPLPFNDFLLESSRNLLNCCPKNAILLTYGDNDTYPLWYVQAKEGFRRDVVVANLSLLAIGRYINHLRDRVFDAAPLNFQISPDFYFSDTSTVIYIREEGGAIPIADFFACVSSKNGEREFGYPVCQVASVYFFTDATGKVLSSATESPRKGNKVEIQLSEKSYLIRDQLAVLDLLYSNTPDRPLCFATTCRGEYLEPFEKHLRLQGLVYRFDPKPMEVLKDLKGAIDVAQSYRYFAKEMKHTSKGEITFDGFPYLATHKNYLFFTARELNKQGKKKKAAELLDRYFEVYPNNRVLFDRSMLYLAFAYADAGKLDKALAIVRQVLDNFEAGKIDWEGYKAWSIETIKSLAKEAKDQDLLKRLERY